MNQLLALAHQPLFMSWFNAGLSAAILGLQIFTIFWQARLNRLMAGGIQVHVAAELVPFDVDRAPAAEPPPEPLRH